MHIAAKVFGILAAWIGLGFAFAMIVIGLETVLERWGWIAWLSGIVTIILVFRAISKGYKYENSQ